MLLRIGLASAIGLCFVVTRLCGGIDYGDSRNSGVGTAWVFCIGLGLMLLLIGIAIAAVWIGFKVRMANP